MPSNTPRSSRDVCMTISSNALDSRVSAVRGHGKVTSHLVRDAPRMRSQNHDARGEKHRLGHRMRDEEHGPFLLGVQPQQFLVQAVARHLIERGKGFVHQQNARPAHQRARNRDAHLHAAGKLPRIALRHMAQAHQFEHLRDALLAEVARGIFEFETQADVLFHRSPWQAVSHPER